MENYKNRVILIKKRPFVTKLQKNMSQRNALFSRVSGQPVTKFVFEK